MHNRLLLALLAAVIASPIIIDHCSKTHPPKPVKRQSSTQSPEYTLQWQEQA